MIMIDSQAGLPGTFFYLFLDGYEIRYLKFN